MGVGDVDASFQCPCCVQCKGCKDFQKVAEIKDTGLVIFRHLFTVDDVNKQTEVLQPAVSPTEDVFILQNTRNVDIPSVKFVPTLETFKISCRRCRMMYERAQKLLQRVPIIGENHVVGICNHCYQKQYPKSCNECEKIVNKFLAAKYDGRDTNDALKTMLSKMEQVLRNVTGDEVKAIKKTTSRAYSDLYIDKTSRLDSRQPNQPQEMRRSDPNIPGSLQYKSAYDKHGDINERAPALGKSDGFLESAAAEQKYRPDQRPISEVHEAARREQSGFGASEQRSIFAEPNRMLKQMPDFNLPSSPLYRTKQARDENAENPLHTFGKSKGFSDPIRTQKLHREDRDGFSESVEAKQKHRINQKLIGEALEAPRREPDRIGVNEHRSIFEDPNIILKPKRDPNLPMSRLYKTKQGRDEKVEKPMHTLGKSSSILNPRRTQKLHNADHDGFLESKGAPMKYRPGQKPTGEALEASKREQIGFVANEQRPIFEEPHKIFRLKEDPNLPKSYLRRKNPARDKNFEKPLQTVGKSSGLIDPISTQKSRHADQRKTDEDLEMGKPAHIRLGINEPRLIFDEADTNKDIKMRDSNISTPHLYKSKHVTEQDLDKSVEFKDSMKSRKKHHPDQRSTPEAVADTKQKRAAKEDSAIHPLFYEDSSIRPLLDKDLNQPPTQKRKKTVSRKISETSVLSDEHGLRIAHKQPSKPIIKKTVPIGSRVTKHVSKETLVSTISRAVQNTLGKELSYFFPMGEISGKPKKLKSTTTSTALILETQKKVEEEKLRKEAEKKAEHERKKYQAEEKAKLFAEKKQLAEEKKKISEEEENERRAEEKRRITEEDEKKRQALEKHKLAEEDKKKKAEETDKRSRTREYDKSQNLTDSKNPDKSKELANKEKDKGGIGNYGKDTLSSPEKNKINGDLDKNKDLKLDRGDKETDKDRKANEKLAQERSKQEKEYHKQEEKERLKREKEYKQEEKETLKSEREEKLRLEKIEKQKEKELKEAEKYKSKEEKELQAKEKNKLPEDKIQRETTKYRDVADSKPKHKSEKEQNEKYQNDGIEDKDLKLKGKHVKDMKSNEDDLKQKDNQRIDKKKDDLEKETTHRDKEEIKKGGLKQAADETNFQEQDDMHMKKGGKNEKRLGEIPKDQNKQNEIDNKKKQMMQQMMNNIQPAGLNKTLTASEKEQAEAQKQKLLDAEQNKQAKAKLPYKNTIEDARLNAGDTKKGKTQISGAAETLKTGQKSEESKGIKGLNLNQLKLSKQGQDDLIVQLVKLKQGDLSSRDKEEAALIDPLIILEHKKHATFPKTPTCVICNNSNLELDIESIELEKTKPKWSDIIIGEKILKFMPPLKPKVEDQSVMPSLFKTVFNADATPMTVSRRKMVEITPEPALTAEALTPKSAKQASINSYTL